MGQRIHRPVLGEHGVSPGDWSDDDSQGVDYELVFGDRYQYCFIEVGFEPVVLDFMAFGLMAEPKVRGHPDVSQWIITDEGIEHETLSHRRDHATSSDSETGGTLADRQERGQ